MIKLFQIGLIIFILSGFILFAIEERRESKLPKKSFDQDSIMSVVNSAYTPNPNLDYDFKWKLIQLPNQKNSFKGFSKKYCDADENILCFRGNNLRDRPTLGTIKNKPSKVKIDWIFTTRKDTSSTRFGKWGGGTGWTGQPLLVRWEKSMKEKLGIIQNHFIEDNEARELIIGSLCGDVYFLDFESGDSTRTPVHIDGPIKGTPSVDPRLNGLLYVGQGIDVGQRFGSYIIDMTKEKIIRHQPGRDPDAARKWGAFDSNPLIDKKTGTVFWPSENGLIYTFQSQNNSKINLVSKLDYSKNIMNRYGIESSMAAIDRYGFFADNSGNIFCVDLVEQTPVWNQNNFDDTDATMVIEKKNNELFLYVGNEVDFRAPEANSSFRKLNAKNGNEIWRIDRTCRGTKIANKTNSGGILATPLVGKKKCKDLVYVIFSRMNEKNQSELVAVNKKTGKEEFSYLMKAYSWASPIDIYDKKGNMYLFFSDVQGTIYLLDGKTGERIYTEKTKYTFESSPIAYDNRIVVGVRGNKILSFLVQ